MKRRQFLSCIGRLVVGGVAMGSAPFVWSRGETKITVPPTAALQKEYGIGSSEFLKRNLRSDVHIEFLPGEHLLTRTLVIPKNMSNVTLTCLGQDAVLTKSGNFPMMRINGSNNKVHNLAFAGGCAESKICEPDVSYGASLLINGDFNIITASKFFNSISNGIHMDGQKTNCQGNVIDGCHIKNNSRVGIAMAAARSTEIRNNVIEQSGFESLTLDLGTQDCLITNNIFSASNRFGGIGAIGYDRCSNIRIASNIFAPIANPKKAHIRAGNATGMSKNISIEGNEFQGANLAIDLRGTTRSISGSTELTISNNQFSSRSAREAVQYDGDDSAIKITNNRFK